ncbi:MAG: MBL fold metallo-hydrolase [Clostridia bacterium]|nr:MBL fold metallo-hydrolase [Clostridia bacterium]
MIFHRFILGDLVTNCYIIADDETKNAALFDAPANAEKILDYAEKNGLNIKYIFLTHAHFDHILALNELKEKTGAQILLHEEEEKYLYDPELNFLGEKADSVVLPAADKLLKDGDIIELDHLSIKVIHTPGHTVGGVCYLIDNILISGDTLFSGAIGRFDFPLGSFDDEIRSIKEKLMVLDDETKVYPGHGFSTTIGKQRKDNPYLI